MSRSSLADLDRPGPQPASLEKASGLYHALGRFVRTSRIGALSALFLFILLLVAFFADQVAPHHPLEATFTALRKPPSWDFWLGTDNLGRDVLSRLIHGARAVTDCGNHLDNPGQSDWVDLGCTHRLCGQ